MFKFDKNKRYVCNTCGNAKVRQKIKNGEEPVIYCPSCKSTDIRVEDR